MPRHNMNKVPAVYATGRPDWQRRAACHGVLTTGALENDRAIFPFPTDKSAETQKFIKNFCHGCPVLQDCLEYAVKHGYTGVWGGMNLSEADIRQLRKVNVFAVASA